MTRAKPRGLERNAAVALGNEGTADEMVRAHAACALARLSGD
jgi:hypothetical protein